MVTPKHETGAEAGAPSEDVEEGWIQQLEFFKEEADPPSCFQETVQTVQATNQQTCGRFLEARDMANRERERKL